LNIKQKHEHEQKHEHKQSKEICTAKGNSPTTSLLVLTWKLLKLCDI